MTVHHQALIDVSELLGITIEDLAEREDISRLAGTFTVSASNVRTLTAAALDGFVHEYGDAARLVIKTGDLVDLTVENGYDAGQLATLVQDAAQTSSTFDAVIDIDKTNLAQALATEIPTANVALFIFESVLQSLLRLSPAAIQEQLWSEPSAPLVLLVLDTDVRISGSCLSIIGGAHLDAPQPASQAVPARLQRLSERRNAYIGWDSTVETALTPAHFYCSPSDAGPSSFEPRLNVLVAGLATLFLCDRARTIVRQEDRPLTQAEFRGRDHVTFVPIDWSEPSLLNLDEACVDKLVGLVDWCYELVPGSESDDALGDRLPFVQTHIARILEARPEDGRLGALAQAAPTISEGVRWQWRSYVEGRVNEYLGHVSSLEAAVDTLVGSLSTQTAALVKRLTETALAALAALIGSFIAATFKYPFQADLFRIGMLSYAGYVAVFPLGLGTVSSAGELKVLKGSFDSQRRNIAAVLGDERVDELVGTRPIDSERRYWSWVRITAIAYIVAVILAAVAAVNVPAAVIETPTTTTTAAVTTTTR